MDKNLRKKKKEMEEAIRVTSISIESDKNDDDVGIEIEGCRLGVLYKMAYTLTELVRIGALEPEDLQHMADMAIKSVEEMQEKEKEEIPFPELEAVDPEELTPEEQALTRAIEEALKGIKGAKHMRVVPMKDKRRKN